MYQYIKLHVPVHINLHLPVHKITCTCIIKNAPAINKHVPIHKLTSLYNVDCTCRIQREPARVMNIEVGVHKPVEEHQHLHQRTQNISRIYLEYI